MSDQVDNHNPIHIAHTLEWISGILLDEFACVESKYSNDIYKYVESVKNGPLSEQITKSGLPLRDILDHIKPKLVEELDKYLIGVYNRQYKDVDVEDLQLYEDIYDMYVRVSKLYDVGCSFPDHKELGCFVLMMDDLYDQFIKMVLNGKIYDIWEMNEQVYYHFIDAVATKSDEKTPDDVLHVIYVRAGNLFFIRLCELGKTDIIKKTCELNLARRMNNFDSCHCDLHFWNNKWPKTEDDRY